MLIFKWVVVFGRRVVGCDMKHNWPCNIIIRPQLYNFKTSEKLIIVFVKIYYVLVTFAWL